MNILWLQSLDSRQAALSVSVFKQLSQPEKLTVNIGSFKKELNVSISKELQEGGIGLPTSLSETYTIPIDIPYEVMIKDNEIHLGPAIGFIVLGSSKKLTKGRLLDLSGRFVEYDSIKGLIFVCTKDLMDLDKGLIEGYYFCSKGKETGNFWRSGKFPIPDAFYNRSFLSQAQMDELKSKVGGRFFNSYWYNLNKWSIWKKLSADETLVKNLPYTERFRKTQQLVDMLDKYKLVYFKPCNRSRGRGIMQAVKTEKQIIITDNKMRKYYLKNKKDLQKFLKEKLSMPYIIQQGIPFSAGKQKLDFRLYLQRDDTMDWACSGVITRIALEGGIITNWQGRSETIPGMDALRKYFGLTQAKAEEIVERMTQIAIRAVSIYEKRGMHLGDLAVDMVLDSNLQLWLLELQLNYDPDGYTNPSIQHIFRKVMITPFKYAKALAGFNN